jgi:hypothetical protein
MRWKDIPELYFRSATMTTAVASNFFGRSDLRRTSCEDLAARIAAQPFHLKHSRLQRRLPDDADQHRRFLLAINLAFSHLRQ